MTTTWALCIFSIVVHSLRKDNMSVVIKELINLPLEEQQKVLKEWSTSSSTFDSTSEDSIEINGNVFILPSVVVGLIKALTDELEELKVKYAIQEN